MLEYCKLATSLWSEYRVVFIWTQSDDADADAAAANSDDGHSEWCGINRYTNKPSCSPAALLRCRRHVVFVVQTITSREYIHRWRNTTLGVVIQPSNWSRPIAFRSVIYTQCPRDRVSREKSIVCMRAVMNQLVINVYRLLKLPPLLLLLQCPICIYIFAIQRLTDLLRAYTPIFISCFLFKILTWEASTDD